MASDSGISTIRSNVDKRKSRGPTHLFYVFGALMVVALFSFLQTVNVMNASGVHKDEAHAVMASLKAFTHSRKNKMQKATTTTIQHRTAADEREDPIPNPIPADGNTTFSACLLVMDDNHRLVEWLAYHYHVLPLRYLIVTIDPRSKTSPTAILNKYRRLGLYVEEWDDFKFMKEEIAKNKLSDEDKLQVKRDRHRMRQKTFYRTCLKRMKDQGRSFTTLIDTDEFITYNHKGGEDFEAWEKARLRRHRKKFPNKERIRPASVPPTTAEEGAMIKYIRTEQAAGTPFFQKACISCPRLQFGAIESTDGERRNNVPPSLELDPDRLDTMRFRKHANRQDFVKNGLSKSILDVSRIGDFPRIPSLHRPLPKICPQPWRDEFSSGLRINHYLGSWESYSFRDDSRRGGERSYEGWAFKAQEGDETDDVVRPWVGGFVESHGPEKASDLLDGAGLERGLKGNDKNWTIMFIDRILNETKTEGNDMRVAFDNFVRDFHFNKNQTLEHA